MHGAAELRPAGVDRSKVVEATFSVERDWHCQGFEKALVLRAIPVARAMGARQMLIDCLGSSEHIVDTVAQCRPRSCCTAATNASWLPLTRHAATVPVAARSSNRGSALPRGRSFVATSVGHAGGAECFRQALPVQKDAAGCLLSSS